jgi:hypothetical protein
MNDIFVSQLMMPGNCVACSAAPITAIPNSPAIEHL